MHRQTYIFEVMLLLYIWWSVFDDLMVWIKPLFFIIFSVFLHPCSIVFNRWISSLCYWLSAISLAFIRWRTVLCLHWSLIFQVCWPCHLYNSTLTDFALCYASTDNHLTMDDSDGDDNSRAYFPCPFCYVEIEVHLFCSHLLDEHCFDLKNAVCDCLWLILIYIMCMFDLRPSTSLVWFISIC